MKIKKRQLLVIMALISMVCSFAQENTSYEYLKGNMNENSLPLVNVIVDISKLEKNNYIPGKIEIADYWQRTDNSPCVSFNCQVKYRGASSIIYDKKSFAIKTTDENGKSLDVSVLGIREDDSWILNAMAVDRIRMRDRVLFDIWNDFSQTPYNTSYQNRNGTKGYFVEVFLNGEYHGLYCLTDKIKRKLLGLKKLKENEDGSINIHGLLYKCNKNSKSSVLSGYDENEPMDADEWNGWELQYPDDYPIEETYAPLRDLIDFCSTTSDEEFLDNFEKHFYKSNLIDYHLFILAYGIHDNLLKNTFLSTTDITTEQRFLITPWDLDTSLGGWYDGTYYNNLFTNSEIIWVKPFSRIWETDYKQEFANKWNAIKDNVFSIDALNKRIQLYADMMISSGAWERERAKWNNNPVELKSNIYDEAKYIMDWYKKNYTNVDNTISISTGIENFAINDCGAKEQQPYNILGQKVTENYRGIIIKDKIKIKK